MFDPSKDLDRYKGVTPYASEHYGVYKPLLGWRSALTKKWLLRGGPVGDPMVRSTLNGRVKPGPTGVINPHPLEFLAQPLEPGAGKTPWQVLIKKDLGSEIVGVIGGHLLAWLNDHGGAMPNGAEWTQVVDINAIMNANNGDMRAVNDIHRTRVAATYNRDIAAGMAPDAALDKARHAHLSLMQFESQVATFLLAFAEAQEGRNPDDLNRIYGVKESAPLDDLFKSTDPLASIDPNDKSGTLSPVGLVHLFRQYFFDLGSFLGEPVEHVWLAPGTTLELVEVSTRRQLVERTEENALETAQTQETSDTQKDELSTATRSENASNVKLGVTNTNTVNYGVYQGTVTASFGIESSRKDAREQNFKTTREQSEKLSTAIKQSVKSVFRTVTETTDTRSRRYVLQNLSEKLVNYELRRKMRRVGVQLQDIGERLCWQVFIDDPAAAVGLSELVHFAEAPDLSSLKDPEDVPQPAAVTKKVTAPIPFAPILDYTNNSANYEFAYLETIDSLYKGKYLSIIKGDEDDDDSQTIIGPFTFTFDPPNPGYVLSNDVRVLGPQGNKIATVHSLTVDGSKNSFTLVLERVNYGGENVINLDVELVSTPGPQAMADYDAKKKVAQAKYDAEKLALARKAFAEDVRARIEAAASIKPRPAWDLREEERTTIYRSLISRLMLDSWKIPATDADKRLSHVRAELIRTIFDVDAMLYFVAPEWWLPRRRHGQLEVNQVVDGKPYQLTGNDTLLWGGEHRADNYRITENSAPARMGSSLGWLMQLDGDNLRNAFLNAPWVKAVIPVRPGHETAALNWLRAIEGHADDGWDSAYVGAAAEDAEFAGKTIGEVLEIIAGRMEATSDVDTVLASDKVFQTGFDPLGNSFDAGLPANQVFGQWISVVPTDQIAASEYVPTLSLEV
jgi:hypothetical protein